MKRIISVGEHLKYSYLKYYF